MDTLGTLGQHEFAFGFCGSTPEVLRWDLVYVGYH